MSALANLYAYLIRNKKRTIKDVPDYLKKEVEELLKVE
ncbi:CD1375 family protein [Peptostreptococcus stomatis]|nr:CD1375 family protein [Peptostreptococcus stomatis]